MNVSAVPRFVTPRNPDRRTIGSEVDEVLRQLGTPPMPWQSYLNAVAYELDEEATEAASSRAGKFQPRLWYREGRVTVPRQSGKTQEALGRHTHRQRFSVLHGWGVRPPTIYMAQTASDARDKMVNEWFPILEDSCFDGREEHNFDALEDGLPLVTQLLRANGLESVKWAGGGRIITKPPSRKGGHGVSAVGVVDLDEAFAHRDGAAEQGVRPAMVTTTCPQIYIVSTAGTEESVFLWDKVEDGRSRCETGQFGRVFYLEYSAYPGATNSPITSTSIPNFADPAVRNGCHPAVGFTISPDVLAAEWDSMDPDEYARAYGNVWTRTVSRVIPAAAWAACLDPTSQIVGELFLAVDASPGVNAGRSSSISVSGWNKDGIPHGEVVASGPGLAWVAPRIAELTRKWTRAGRLYVDPTGPIGSVLPDIEKSSLAKVEVVDARTMAAACGRFHEDVLTERFRHLGQDSLDSAVEGAAKRQLLDAWAWGRRGSASDISALVAVTLSHWGCVNRPPREARIL